MSLRGNPAGDQEHFDDSASNDIGSEMSYSSQVTPSNQIPPQVQMHNLPLPVSAMHLAAAATAKNAINAVTVSDLSESTAAMMARARPGKRPAKADEELTPEELRRRNKRRLRNREAAQRCRQRRLGQIEMLQNEVEQLKESKQNLATENDKLKDELAKLKFQLSVTVPTTVVPAAAAAVAPPHQPTLAPPSVVASPQGAPVKVEAQSTSSTGTESGQIPVTTIPSTLPLHPSTLSQHHASPTLLPMLSPILVPFNSAFYSIGAQGGVLTPNTPLTSARGVRFSFPQVSPEALEAARKSSVSALAELSNTMAVL